MSRVVNEKLLDCGLEVLPHSDYRQYLSLPVLDLPPEAEETGEYMSFFISSKALCCIIRAVRGMSSESVLDRIVKPPKRCDSVIEK